MKLVTIVGARPQFIKAASGSRALRKVHEEILVHTGQHHDENMSEVFFREMEIPTPDYSLGIAGGTHGEMTGRMLIEIEKVLLKEQPDGVLLYGDTNSTVAGALAAVKLHIPVIHVEAGNRLGTMYSPEEVNRILTAHCSSLLLCATRDAKDKLKKENLGDKAHVVGNIMYDSFLHFANKPWDHPEVIGLDGNPVVIPEEFYFMTCHRQENTYSDEPLTEILAAMDSLDAPTIYAVHPRNHERAKRVVANNGFKNIILTQPVKYSDSVQLVSRAKKVVTDSGGLQCEAFYAGVQCVLVLDYVVWPETMVYNRNQLAKPNKEDILEKLSAKQYVDKDYKPFGDGHAAEKITQLITEFFENRNK